MVKSSLTLLKTIAIIITISKEYLFKHVPVSDHAVLHVIRHLHFLFWEIQLVGIDVVPIHLSTISSEGIFQKITHIQQNIII